MNVRSASDVDDALMRIERDDAELQAWAFVATAAGDLRTAPGPLQGMPFGVKDIIDVARMPTAHGWWREHRKARLDAWCVAALRSAGAVPVGKTRTTPHAFRDPAPTRNPLDPARTPGGSSSGSAAAVAAGHVPFALGTQTIGSILRPAAYCGVVGFKPTWGRIPMNGVAPLAPSLDHLGVIAADVATATRVARVLVPALEAEDGTPSRVAVATSVDGADRTVQAALATLRGAGIQLDTVALPASVDAALEQTDAIVAFEAHAGLGPLLAFELPKELRTVLERGAGVTRSAYARALADARDATARAEAVLAPFDGVIVPCVAAAPDRTTTGDVAPFAAWSLYGEPAIAIPIPRTAPAAVSLQLVARRGADARLLALAARVEAALAAA